MPSGTAGEILPSSRSLTFSVAVAAVVAAAASVAGVADLSMSFVVNLALRLFSICERNQILATSLVRTKDMGGYGRTGGFLRPHMLTFKVEST